jgi:hypothetical protein
MRMMINAVTAGRANSIQRVGPPAMMAQTISPKRRGKNKKPSGNHHTQAGGSRCHHFGAPESDLIVAALCVLPAKLDKRLP